MSLFETLLALFSGIMFLGLVALVVHDSNLRTERRVVAENMLILADATKTFVRANHLALAATATPAAGPQITVQELVDAGILRQNFAEINQWGQAYNIHVRSPAVGGDLLRIIIITTGGPQRRRAFTNVHVPATAALIGAAGAYTPTGDIPTAPLGSIHGAGGNWDIPLAAVGIADPGPGHIAYVSDFDASHMAGEFLYRVEVPGNPELNTMRTELNMADNAIRNVRELQFVEREISDESCIDPADQGRMFLDRLHGMYVCRDGQFEIIADSGNSTLIKEFSVVPSGTFIDKPLCAPGTATVPQIYVAPSIAEAGPEAPPLSSFQAWAEDISDAQWRVLMRVLIGEEKIALGLNAGVDTGGWIFPDQDYNRVLVITSCGKEFTVPPGP